MWMLWSVLYFLLCEKNTSLLQAMEYIKQSKILVKLNVTHSWCVTVLLLVFLCKEILFWYWLKLNLILEHLRSCKWCPHNVQGGNSGLGGVIWKRLLDYIFVIKMNAATNEYTQVHYQFRKKIHNLIWYCFIIASFSRVRA